MFIKWIGGYIGILILPKLMFEYILHVLKFYFSCYHFDFSMDIVHNFVDYK